MHFTQAQIKEVANRSTFWHVGGITPDQTLIRIVDDEDKVVAYIPLELGVDDYDRTKAFATAQLVLTSGSMFLTVAKMLAWADRKPGKDGPPRPLRRQIISVISRVLGQV